MTHRAEAVTTEQEQRAKWDLLLLDLERRTEQVRLLKSPDPCWLVLQGLVAGAALFAAGVAFAILVTT
jgi:hypothetical protein